MKKKILLSLMFGSALFATQNNNVNEFQNNQEDQDLSDDDQIQWDPYKRFLENPHIVIRAGHRVTEDQWAVWNANAASIYDERYAAIRRNTINLMHNLYYFYRFERSYLKGETEPYYFGINLHKVYENKREKWENNIIAMIQQGVDTKYVYAQFFGNNINISLKDRLGSLILGVGSYRILKAFIDAGYEASYDKGILLDLKRDNLLVDLDAIKSLLKIEESGYPLGVFDRQDRITDNMDLILDKCENGTINTDDFNVEIRDEIVDGVWHPFIFDVVTCDIKRINNEKSSGGQENSELKGFKAFVEKYIRDGKERELAMLLTVKHDGIANIFDIVDNECHWFSFDQEHINRIKLQIQEVLNYISEGQNQNTAL